MFIDGLAINFATYKQKYYHCKTSDAFAFFSNLL